MANATTTLEVDPFVDFLNEELDCIPEDNETDSEDEDKLTSHMYATTTICVKDTTHLCISIHTEEFQHIAIMDSGPDTCVIGQGWDIIAEHPTCCAKVFRFDHSMAAKKNLPIVSAIAAVDFGDKTIMVRIHEAVYNENAKHALLSTYQLTE